MKRILVVLGSLLTGGLLTAVGAYLISVESQPDLHPWHRIAPKSEFHAELDPGDWTLEQYLELENNLFSEVPKALERKGVDSAKWGRFRPDSPTNPLNFERNWNRTFLLQPAEPQGIAVMIHGLSDSPYSVRPLARILEREGYTVIGLRVPGHGTVPGALTRAQWEDWRAVLRIAGREVVARRAADGPFVMAGYSNGAALAVDYTLDALEDETLPVPDRLIFLSPALAVSKVAALAKWQLLMSRLPFFKKLGWNSVLPEYDPYKYNSFALNAARQIYRLTSSVDRRLQRLSDRGQINDLPPVLAIQSAVDSTVPAVASLSRWFGRLEGGDDELVLFDVNRIAQAEMFLGPAANTLLESLEAGLPYPYDLSIVGNHTEQSLGLIERAWHPGSILPEERPLGLSWPRGIFSLSHVAVPFPADDPIYGVGTSQQEPFPFGNIEARGENGVLTVPITLLMRLRYNPFFLYLDEKVVEFISPPEIGAKIVGPDSD